MTMAAIRGVPHPFPYQGSKRQLAREILSCFPKRLVRLIEPFAGSGAITLAAAYLGLARRFVLNDAHRPLMSLWKALVNEPQALADGYRRLWHEQAGQEREYFDRVRGEFNRDHAPEHFLYLLARAVKAAVRYNAQGGFNNSPDNRRRGMQPDEMERNIARASRLLKGRIKMTCTDYRACLARAEPQDLVYMDPPYQGVCKTHDHRYCHSVGFDDFVGVLRELNARRISYIVSYDGRTGPKSHGRLLPPELGLAHLEVLAGRSTQATLLGMTALTYESLYLSPALLRRIGGKPKALLPCKQKALFGACS
jgi:DNA adenine methylase